MREILFRGKRVDNGKWFEGCLATFKDGDCAIFDPNDEETPLYQVDSETVGQYIGFLDRKNIKVYEGDIIATNTDICVIKWQGSRFIAQKANKRPMTLQYIKFSGEVIGNIYDNPELLKGAN